MSQGAELAGAYPGVCSMKRLGVFVLPTGWHASPSQGYSQDYLCQYPFVHLSRELGTVGVKCPRTQHNDPAMAQTQTT